MKTQSAGILVYRKSLEGIEVFLAHPGGPFFARKDEGYWGIPKGLFEEGETAMTAAYREFKEETGQDAPDGETIELTPVHRKDGKTIHAWAIEDTTGITFLGSNLCEVEWPPRSGRMIEVPEIDRAEWFTLAEARTKIGKTQVAFLDELKAKLSASA